MNPYFASLVAYEQMQDRVKEAEDRRIRRQLARRSTTVGAVRLFLLAAGQAFVEAGNRLRTTGEQGYAVQVCCVA